MINWAESVEYLVRLNIQFGCYISKLHVTLGYSYKPLVEFTNDQRARVLLVLPRPIAAFKYTVS